jgi:hypothetical protein
MRVAGFRSLERSHGIGKRKALCDQRSQTPGTDPLQHRARWPRDSDEVLRQVGVDLPRVLSVEIAPLTVGDPAAATSLAKTALAVATPNSRKAEAVTLGMAIGGIAVHT